MANDFIEYKGNPLFYFKWGRGEKGLLLFHGFGQDHSAFDSWIASIENEFTVYTFDLFFHGKSEWISDQLIEKGDWEKMLNQFFQKENLSEITVAGFSLGAKFALATLELFPHRVKKIILLAPDGIKLNFWYKLATSFYLTRWIFRKFVSFPYPFFLLLKILDYLKITNKFLLRFAYSQMNTEEKRQNVYNSWVYFRKLKFDMKLITEKINENGIEVITIMGQYDKVIPVRMVESFIKTIPHAKFYILDTGHNDLILNSISRISSDSQH